MTKFRFRFTGGGDREILKRLVLQGRMRAMVQWVLCLDLVASGRRGHCGGNGAVALMD